MIRGFTITGNPLGQVLHSSARTTAAVRRTIPQHQERLQTRAERDDIHPKTVAKRTRRASVPDAPRGPKEPRSTGLTNAQEALGVACRRPTLLPLDDCLDAVQDRIPNRTRSTVHRCDQRHGLNRLPEVAGTTPAKRKFQTSPLGSCHLDMAEVQTEGGRLYHFVAIERARKFAVAELHAKATRRIAAHVLRALIAAVPDKIHTVWTDHGTSFTALTHVRNGADQQEEVQHPEGVSLIQAYEPCLSTRSFRHVPSPRVRPSNMLLGCPPVCCMAHRKMTSTSAHGTSRPTGIIATPGTCRTAGVNAAAGPLPCVLAVRAFDARCLARYHTR